LIEWVWILARNEGAVNALTNKNYLFSGFSEVV